MTAARAHILRLLHLSARYLRQRKPRVAIKIEIGERIWHVA